MFDPVGWMYSMMTVLASACHLASAFPLSYCFTIIPLPVSLPPYSPPYSHPLSAIYTRNTDPYRSLIVVYPNGLVSWHHSYQRTHHRHHTKKLIAHPPFAHINYILRLRTVAHPVLRATISPPIIVPLLVMHHFSTLHHKSIHHMVFVVSRPWAFKGLRT